MHPVLRGTVVVAGAGAGVIAVRRLTIRQLGNGTHRETRDRWHALTINRPPEEVAPEGRLPEPLAALGDTIEVRTRPAPGDRGTEVSARLRKGASSGRQALQQLRTALRASKQLIETGEILSPDQPPTTRRTLTGLPLELATRRARGEGRL